MMAKWSAVWSCSLKLSILIISLFIIWLIVSVHISKTWIYLDEGGMTNQGFARVGNLTSIWWSSRLIRGPVACTERAEDMARNGGASARMCGIQQGRDLCLWLHAGGYFQPSFTKRASRASSEAKKSLQMSGYLQSGGSQGLVVSNIQTASLGSIWPFQQLARKVNNAFLVGGDDGGERRKESLTSDIGFSCNCVFCPSNDPIWPDD